MLKKVAAALIAVTMSTTPVLAQSAAPVRSAIEQVKTKKAHSYSDFDQTGACAVTH
jgi:hypothetical protein